MNTESTQTPESLGSPLCYGSWRHDCSPLGEDMQDEDDGDGPIFGSDDVLISISGSRVAIGAFFRENRGDYWLEWTSTYVPLGEKEVVDGWMPLPAPFCHNNPSAGTAAESATSNPIESHE